MIGIGCQILALLGTGVALFGLASYLSGPQYPNNSEALIRTQIGLFWAATTSISASAIALVTESGISRRLFRWLFFPGATFLALILLGVLVELMLCAS